MTRNLPRGLWSYQSIVMDCISLLFIFLGLFILYFNELGWLFIGFSVSHFLNKILGELNK